MVIQMKVDSILNSYKHSIMKFSSYYPHEAWYVTGLKFTIESLLKELLNLFVKLSSKYSIKKGRFQRNSFIPKKENAVLSIMNTNSNKNKI